jgi:hypothetical protein
MEKWCECSWSWQGWEVLQVDSQTHKLQVKVRSTLSTSIWKYFPNNFVIADKDIHWSRNCWLTPIKNPIKGKSVRPVNASETSLGGLFSGTRKMCDISFCGANFANGSTACAGGRGAFSEGSGKSNSRWPRARRNEFSWSRQRKISKAKRNRTVEI